jgi:hypothetical protein
MKNVLKTPATYGITRRDGLLTLLGSALALAGCGGGGGGGGDVAAVSGGGTGSFSVGPITGFGSIIVNGVRFDDTRARVSDDDGNDMVGKLMLGMVVRVKGGKLAANGRADASTIEARSELLGPIDSIDTVAKTLVVLGQTVQVTTTTIFEDGLGGLSVLLQDDIVEVHGFVNPVDNHLTATRIERKIPATTVKAFKLQGTVSAFDATLKTFKIGSLTISFATSVNTPASLTLANGMLVRVRLASTPTTGTRTALKIHAVQLEIEDCDESEVKGTVTAVTSATLFSVNGVPVDASGASVRAGLKLGDRVEVEGSLVKGVLMAKKVQLDDETDQHKFELHGTIDNTLNTTTKSFVLRGVTVNYSGIVEFLPTGKSASDLVNGARVEVKGKASTDGTQVIATRITFE